MTDQQLTELLRLLNLIHNQMDEILTLLIKVGEKLSTEKAGDK